MRGNWPQDQALKSPRAQGTLLPLLPVGLLGILLTCAMSPCACAAVSCYCVHSCVLAAPRRPRLR